LASIVKYPCESTGKNPKQSFIKKYGFFQTEKSLVKRLMKELHIPEISESPLVFNRHPFVYLTEAADDIAYHFIDMEDAHRLKILPYLEVEEAFMNVICMVSRNERDRVVRTLKDIKDVNEKVSYLRAKVIYGLIMKSVEVFEGYLKDFESGKNPESIMDQIEREVPSLKEIKKISVEKIYRHPTVITIELSGYQILNKLLALYIPAVLKKVPNAKEKKAIRLIPRQFYISEKQTHYENVRSVLDFISGMTDLYAVEFYKETMGISVPVI
jgi:dGTPase